LLSAIHDIITDTKHSFN